ncbi:hypothetical protein BH11ARM1_BH11ARM1_07660 [soil metagenome]
MLAGELRNQIDRLWAPLWPEQVYDLSGASQTIESFPVVQDSTRMNS